MHTLRVALLTALLTVLLVPAEPCSSVSGPAGEFVCISFSAYGGKQYATCLTNTYIKLKSGNRHACINTAATYCYYQCMLEIHNAETGNVTPDCSCGDSTGVTPTPFTGTTLPPLCYSPSGDDCSWYTNCLERRFHCGPDTGYAIAFGKKYCELYAASYSSFSRLTQQWVDAVRKCLQVALVPLLRQYRQPTCDEVKDTAISSHTGCYVTPAVGQPSICDVMYYQTSDILRIFWTIKGALVEPDMVVIWGTWKSFGQVIYYCLLKPPVIITGTAVYDAVIYSYSMAKSTFGRRKRSTVTDPGDIAVRFATALSDSLGWKALGIDWIPLAGNYTLTGAVTFRLLIGDQRRFDLNRNFSQPIDFQAEMQRFKTKVQNGEMLFTLSDGPFYMRQLSECGSFNCTVVSSTIVAPTEPKSAQVMLGLRAMVMMCVLLGVASFC